MVLLHMQQVGHSQITISHQTQQDMFLLQQMLYKIITNSHICISNICNRSRIYSICIRIFYFCINIMGSNNIRTICICNFYFPKFCIRLINLFIKTPSCNRLCFYFYTFKHSRRISFYNNRCRNLRNL